jgi:hypothetical protein
MHARSKCKLAPESANRKAPRLPGNCCAKRSGTGSRKEPIPPASRYGLPAGAKTDTRRPAPADPRGKHGSGLHPYLGQDSWTLTRFGHVPETYDAKWVLCDYDFRRVPRVRPMFAVLRTIGLRPVLLRTDRTRRGWHVLIKLSRALQPAETVAVQALLGSDSRRESLNLMRAMSVVRRDPGPFWRRRWNLLFSSKLRDRKPANKRRRRI